jgi:hypothetical protein
VKITVTQYIFYGVIIEVAAFLITRLLTRLTGGIRGLFVPALHRAVANAWSVVKALAAQIIERDRKSTSPTILKNLLGARIDLLSPTLMG